MCQRSGLTTQTRCAAITCGENLPTLSSRPVSKHNGDLFRWVGDRTRGLYSRGTGLDCLKRYAAAAGFAFDLCQIGRDRNLNQLVETTKWVSNSGQLHSITPEELSSVSTEGYFGKTLGRSTIGPFLMSDQTRGLYIPGTGGSTA